MAAISRRSVRERLEMATAERTDLADLLATLTLQQWEAPSLCERWRVRDVVAHVMSSTASPCPTCFTAPSAVASSTSTRSTWTNSHRSAPNSSWTGCVLTFDRKGPRLAYSMSPSIIKTSVARSECHTRSQPNDCIASWTTACAAPSSPGGTSPVAYA